MSDDRVLIQRAEMLLHAGRAREAGQVAGRYLTNHPGDLDALVVLARARLELGDVAGAVADAEQALTADPENEDTWLLLSVVCSAAGLHSRAVDAARRCVALAPGDWRVHVVLSSTLCQRGWAENREEAVSAARRAVAIAPYEPDALATLGDALRLQDRGSQARSAYQDALGIDPEHEGARFGLSALNVDLDHRNAFTQLLGENPGNAVYAAVHTLTTAAALGMLGVIGVIGGLVSLLMYLVATEITQLSVLLIVGLFTFMYASTLFMQLHRRWLHLPTVLRHFPPLRAVLVAVPLSLVAAALLAALAVPAPIGASVVAAFVAADALLAWWMYATTRRMQRVFEEAFPERGGEAGFEDGEAELERELDRLEGEIQSLGRTVAAIRNNLLVFGLLFGLVPLAALARPNGYWLTIICYGVVVIIIVASQVMSTRRRRLRVRRDEVAALLGRQLEPDPTAREEMRAWRHDFVTRGNEAQARMKQEEQEKKRLRKLKRLEKR